MLPRSVPLWVGATLTVLAMGGSARAEPPTSEACVAAYETSQTLREQGQLRQARASLLVCAQDGCPSAARKDCVPWLAEVEAALPTALISVSSGFPPDEIVVTVDDARVDWAAGRPVPLDPGSHTIVVSHGGARATQSVVLLEGVKGQAIAIELREGGPAAPPPARPAPPSSEGRSLLLPVALGAVAVSGFGVFAGFGLASMSEESSLEETCSPNCVESDVDTVRTERLVSGIGLGVGVAATVGFVLSLMLGGDEAAPVAAQIVPTSSGLGVSSQW